MTTDGRATGLVIAAGQGRRLQVGPTRPTVKVGPPNGSRLIGMLESELPPGGGFPGHSHDDYEEAFYVLAGEVEYVIGSTWTSVPAGSAVFIPRARCTASATPATNASGTWPSPARPRR
jgi:quercetin dioxygenase-like cupin family protein